MAKNDSTTVATSSSGATQGAQQQASTRKITTRIAGMMTRLSRADSVLMSCTTAVPPPTSTSGADLVDGRAQVEHGRLGLRAVGGGGQQGLHLDEPVDLRGGPLGPRRAGPRR